LDIAGCSEQFQTKTHRHCRVGISRHC